MAGLIRFALKGYYVSWTMVGLTSSTLSMVYFSTRNRISDSGDVAGMQAAPSDAKLLNDSFRLVAVHQMTMCVAGIGLMFMGYWKAISVTMIANGLTVLLGSRLQGSRTISPEKWYRQGPIIYLLAGGALFCLT